MMVISDRNSRRPKGTAYGEFVAASNTINQPASFKSANHSTEFTGGKKQSCSNGEQKGSAGLMRLYVGSLHFNITEDMFGGLFEPFGRIESL